MKPLINQEPVVARLYDFMLQNNLNPTVVAEKLGYESGEKLYRLFRVQGAKPSLDIIEDLTNMFENLSVEWLIKGVNTQKQKKASAIVLNEEPSGYMRLPKVVVTDDKKKENIFFLDSKAAAGFPAHINDESFYKKLPTLKIPNIVGDSKTFACVQVIGDSMEPTILANSYVVGEFMDDYRLIKGGQIYLLVTKDGVVCKRLYKKDKEPTIYKVVSDNHLYEDFEINVNDCLQIYKYVCDIRFNTNYWDNNTIVELNKRITKIEKQLKQVTV